VLLQPAVVLASLGWWAHHLADPTAFFAEAIPDVPRRGMETATARARTLAIP
jgi:hypothetical protein